MSLASFLAPVDFDEFIDRYYVERSLYVGDQPEKRRLLDFDSERLYEIIQRLPSSTTREVLNFAYLRPTGDLAQRKVPDGAMAPALFEAGLTIQLLHINRFSEPIRDACAAMADELGGVRVAATAIHSGIDKGFAMHFDAENVLVFQLEGSKRWWFGRRPSVHDAGEIQQQVLSPGDVLYLPAGTFHKARAVEGPSLHVSFAIEPATPARLILALLERAAPHHEGWHRHFLPEPAQRGDLRRRNGEHFASVLEGVRAFLSRMTYETATSELRRDPPREGAGADLLEPGATFAIDYSLAYEVLWHADEPVCRIYDRDRVTGTEAEESLLTPVSALPILQAMSKLQRFSGTELLDQARLDVSHWNEVRAFLAELLSAGLLRRAQEHSRIGASGE